MDDLVDDLHDLAAVTGMALNRIPVEVWSCSDCGCVFLPDWIGGEPGEVYPDRYEMAVPSRNEPDNHQCDCHVLPRKVKVRPPGPTRQWMTDQGYLWCDGCEDNPAGCGWTDQNDIPVDPIVVWGDHNNEIWENA